jgi:hypothetical protein
MSERINVRLPDELVVDCKAWAKSQGITLTDMIIAGLLEQLHGKNKPCQPMPEPEIVVPAASCTVCAPDHIRQVKQHKVSASKQAAPVVAALLSSINKRVTVSHHVQCSCAMCK